jgi:hypothetical protein
MSVYRLNYTSMIETKDMDNLKNILGIVDDTDTLTIVIENNLIPESDRILSVLHENGFDCKTSSRNDGMNFTITATKEFAKDIIDIT